MKLKKAIATLFFVLFAVPIVFAQNEQIGKGFSKANKKSIDNEMANLISRVSEEMNCQVDSISYTIAEKYTVFYTKPTKHLPKVFIFHCSGESVTYKHNGLSGAVLYWLLGSWVRQKL